EGITIEISDPRDAAWVIVGPPDYAPAIRPIVSLYDVVREVAIDANWLNDDGAVEYHRDILPILSRTADLAWVSNDVRRGHKRPLSEANSKEDRARLLARIRNPTADAKTKQIQARSTFMPPLSGDAGAARNGRPDTWLSLLPSQYRKLLEWRDGNF